AASLAGSESTRGTVARVESSGTTPRAHAATSHASAVAGSGAGSSTATPPPSASRPAPRSCARASISRRRTSRPWTRTTKSDAVSSERLIVRARILYSLRAVRLPLEVHTRLEELIDPPPPADRELLDAL